MCRLLAYAGESAQDVKSLLGAEDFSSFRALARLHRDGWGMAWVSGLSEAEHGDPSRPIPCEGRIGSTRSVVPALEDPAFDHFAGLGLGAAGFVHLRWATSGLAVTPENTHPFLAEGWAFAHQGSIPHPERLDGLLAPNWSSRVRGTTDSERYFLNILEKIEEAGDVVTGTRSAVASILQACGSASLNAVLLSTEALVIVHGSSGLQPPFEDLLVACTRPEDVPLDHLNAYFALRYRARDGEIVVTSSGIPGDGWTEMPDDSILHIDLASRAWNVHSLDIPASGSARSA